MVQDYAKHKQTEVEGLKQAMDASSKEAENDRIKVGYLEVSDSMRGLENAATNFCELSLCATGRNQAQQVAARHI